MVEFYSTLSRLQVGHPRKKNRRSRQDGRVLLDSKPTTSRPSQEKSAIAAGWSSFTRLSADYKSAIPEKNRRSQQDGRVLLDSQPTTSRRSQKKIGDPSRMVEFYSTLSRLQVGHPRRSRRSQKKSAIPAGLVKPSLVRRFTPRLLPLPPCPCVTQ